VLMSCTRVNMMFVILLLVYIHTGLKTVGIEPTTFGTELHGQVGSSM
jgi:hypothetical protein